MTHTRKIQAAILVGFLVLGWLEGPATAADDHKQDSSWVEPMRQVHARFTGTPGTFAHFGDSITVTMAFWSPLQYGPKNMSPELARALEVVKVHMKPDCWSKWKGPAFGNQGSMTIRWAHDNVDRWLKVHNPEVALIMFGTNDLTQVPQPEYEQKTREVIEKCLKNGTVVILTTIPPRSGLVEKSKQYAETARNIARELKVPLLDYQAEILKRRPDDWDGTRAQFKGTPGGVYEVPTLISGDGVHPSNPGKFKDFSDESLRSNGYVLRSYLTALAYAEVIRKVAAPADKPDMAPLRKALTFYASFDEAIRGSMGGGELALSTRSNHPTEMGKFVFEKGFSDKAFRIARGKGIHGGALEAFDVLPRNGRVFFPAKGNLAFRKGGWGGAVSVWINTDPNTLLKTKFCDPIQITQKGANNGGIWFDFNDARPRDLRHGAFPAIPEGQPGIKEEDPKAPMVRVPGVGFKVGEWHHVVLSWRSFDTGRPDAVSALWIDGKLIGEVKDRALTMDWDIEKAGIYVAVNYIGLLDELALFDRPLTAEEIGELYRKPGLLAAPKKASAKPGEGEAAGLNQPRGTDEGPAKAEQTLRSLYRSPQPGDGPAAPAFPFDAMAARRYQRACADRLGLPVEFTNGLGMKFTLVPPGAFRMGSPEEEAGHNGGGYDETLHSVTLRQPFYLGQHEVTTGQFRRFVEATGYVTDGEKNGGGHAHDARAVWKHRPGTSWRQPGYVGPFTLKDDHPVVHVSHDDCKAFCAWLQQRSGLTVEQGFVYDLPTEAQWEWACRAGTQARFWWGPDEDTTGQVINAGDRTLKRIHPDWPRKTMAMDDGHAFSAPVGSYRANGFGLHDMLGNVWEFCSTRYGPYPKESVIDPGDGDPKRGFAVRGGGWSNIPDDCRCASRNADPPSFCHSNLGFRVALRIPSRRPAGTR